MSYCSRLVYTVRPSGCGELFLSTSGLSDRFVLIGLSAGREDITINH